MSETFRQVVGRKVVSRSSAQELGTVSDFLYDGVRRSIAAIVLGHGRKARIVDWKNVTGFGADAVMVSDDDALREPADERESQACSGKLGLVGKRALTETGNELGTVDDVVFDPRDGRVLALVVAGKERPAEGLLGAGSYAAVMEAEQEPVT